MASTPVPQPRSSTRAKPATAGYTVERFEAERGGGVVAGAEGLAGLDLDGAATAAGAVAVVAAVHEEAACGHRRQGRLR